MSVTPIHVFAKWKVRPGQLENVLLILKELKAKSVQEKGNLFYQVHQDNSDPNTLILFEGYSDDSALTLHRNAGYYIQAVVENMRTLLTDREGILTTPAGMAYVRQHIVGYTAVAHELSDNSLAAFNFRPPLNFQFPGERKRQTAVN